MISLKVGPMRARNLSIWPVAVLWVAAASCNPTGPTGPTAGTIRVTVSTTGGDYDLDGYVLVLDANPGQTVDVYGTRSFSKLAPGPHTIELSGVADNCSVSPRLQSVTVTPGSTVVVAFTVGCVATGVQITAATTGLDVPSFAVAVDGVALSFVSPGAPLTIGRLRAGSHMVTLVDVAANCTVEGSNDRQVVVAAGSVTPVVFAISCLAMTGSVEVTAVTEGSDRDVTGFTVRVDAGPTRALASNGVVTIEQLAAGDHSIRLDGVASNCTIEGDNPRTLQVTAGGAERDTSHTMFQVRCVTLWKIAFVRNGSVAVASENGSVIEVLTGGGTPAWSPDGAKLAYNCGSVCVMNVDGTGRTQLTRGPTFDEGAVWRPDGAKLAFVAINCDYYYECYLDGLYLINPDGTGRSKVPLFAGLLRISDPAWSPDGTQLAFTCWLVEGHSDICLSNPDGTGFRRLTDDPADDGGPDWKPDGMRIAFHTTRFNNTLELALMNPDGSGLTRVSPGLLAWDPSWSPDGLKFAFTALSCTTSGCFNSLFVMNADGTGVTRLTTGRDDYSSDWRP